MYSCMDCKYHLHWEELGGFFFECILEHYAGLSEEELEKLELKSPINFLFELAQRCEKFSPIMVEKCAYCGKEINSPAYLWKIWGHNEWDIVPCCSEKCKKEMEKESLKEIELPFD